MIAMLLAAVIAATPASAGRWQPPGPMVTISDVCTDDSHVITVHVRPGRHQRAVRFAVPWLGVGTLTLRRGDADPQLWYWPNEQDFVGIKVWVRLGPGHRRVLYDEWYPVVPCIIEDGVA